MYYNKKCRHNSIKPSFKKAVNLPLIISINSFPCFNYLRSTQINYTTNYYPRAMDHFVFQKQLKFIFALVLIVSGKLNLSAQDFPQKINCPQIPMKGKFDTLCYFYVDEIQLGQGTVEGLYNNNHAKLIDLYIPKNRPTYAIAIAHAWQYLRNVLRTKNYPSINNWLVTSAKESFFYCDCEAEWDPAHLNTPKINYPDNCKDPKITKNGCFHIADYAGYELLKTVYHDRFPSDGHKDLVSGGNFETSAILKSYYDIYGVRTIQYVWGTNPFDLLDKTKDPYAFDRILADVYNRGLDKQAMIQLFSPDRLRPQFEASNCWEQVPGYPLEGHTGYTRQISKAIAVLSNNMSYPTVNDDCKFGGFYDTQISWQLMEEYMDKLFVLYKEQDKTKIKAAVKKKFDAIKGGQPISFRYEFGPVLDAFIIALPKEDPMRTALHNDSDHSGCIGSEAPSSHIETTGQLEICTGDSISLNAVLDSGEFKNNTFNWYKDGSWLFNATKSSLVVKTPGLYSVEVCDSIGICAPACCGISVSIKPASACVTSLEKQDYSNINLSISPNPTDNVFEIRFNSIKKENYLIEVIDLLGQKVFVNHLEDFYGLYKKQVNLSNNNAGIYFLRLRFENKAIAKKIIKY